MRILFAVFLLSLSLFNESSAFDLKCKYEVVHWRYAAGDACMAQEFSIRTTSSNIISSVDGSYRAEPNVTAFISRHQKVMKFPHELGTFFPKLLGIEIFNASLKTLSQSDLKPLVRLQELWLANNEIEFLESDLFEYNTELLIVVFSRNKLKYIGENILDPLSKVAKINFNHNKCIDAFAGTRWDRQTIEKQLNSNCSRPRKIDIMDIARNERSELNEKLLMAENKLKLVEGNLAAATKHLLEANKKTDTKYIPGDLKNPVTDLMCKDEGIDACDAVDLKITLPHTEIRLVTRQNNFVVILGQVKSLTITEQQVLFMPMNLANYFTNLTHLAVSFTGIFSIDLQAYESLTNLVYLSLNRSVIHEVPTDAFVNLKNLQELDLSFNQIKKVERRGFNGLDKLQMLRLNDNLIEELQGNTFESLRNLLSLSMNNNRLATIEINLFMPLTKLQLADFLDNECISMSTANNSIQEIATEMRDAC